MYFTNVLDMIGNTPLVSLEETTGMNIFAKAEFLNPGGSIKDRIALNMILEAEKDGRLRPGMTNIEPTSGNTGIGLALCGVRKGYRVIIVMPENMSKVFGMDKALDTQDVVRRRSRDAHEGVSRMSSRNRPGPLLLPPRRTII